MHRLHPSTLTESNADVRGPAYARDQLRTGIVHLGIGAFHRAHQAVYTDDAMGLCAPDWGILGVSLRSAATAGRLNPQDGLYSVLSRDANASELRVIGAVRRVLVAPRELPAVIAAIADPATRMVTLTITEKGYALAADGHSLDRQDPALRADLDDPQHPVSALGVLALGLRARAGQGDAPLSILSCDNLAHNSRCLRAVLVEYLQQCFPQILDWFERNTTFPCSMVDRIVPAMSAAGLDEQAAALGLRDEGAVSTEPFSQWIIEDDFAAGHPPWERVGAQLVDDIAPYENIKLRLLNASHSAIACCGLLAGVDTVDQVMDDAALGEFVRRLMSQDLMPALQVPADFDLAGYRDQLLQRFGNPRLAHRCAQIAMDSSEKIAQRWLPTLQQNRAPQLRRALAAWCYLVLATDIAVEDPRREQLLAQRASTAPLAGKVEAVLACARITPAAVADFAGLRDELLQGMDSIERDGLRALLASPLAAANEYS